MSLDRFVSLWPEQGSHYAEQVDWLVIGFTGMMALFVVPVFVFLWIFVFRYRRGRAALRDHRPDGSLKVEITWMLLPFIGALVLFVYSARLFFEARTPPADALEIQVTAKQWMWKFQHHGGQREINTLHVPAERAVKLTMISEDVIHSLFLPSLRVKQDVLPGRYTQMWFQAERPGTYDLYCAEYCGTDHAAMGARLVVLSPSDYQRWLEGAGDAPSLAAQGEALFRQFGCSGCHAVASVTRAPPLQGLYGRSVALADGSRVVADDAYLRDSILLPQKQVVAGYAPVMPTYTHVMDEEAVARLVAYIRSLADTPPDPSPPHTEDPQ
ncbi:cytochrome c oxidase subunit II [Pseudomonas sp. RIT-PI-AD]|uniref:cytochrome c oxidase subunit II n=1 Tax=Pseudomonas sp. RIT-PI-AD TaxID=3035294 RepID=UPI0021DAEDB0|nr:cytochrome c oxidase subunit II [Pseudomonas sp. RIT-PI-AD]